MVKKTRLKLYMMCFLLSNGEGLFHVPISYTRTTGLQSVNGSDAFGGCPQTPQNCRATEGAVDVCRCPSNPPTTGVLIDGVIPTIDPVFDVNWASELFTVNRNGQSSIVIGFSFLSSFVLRGVEIKLFNCPAWNIAASTINVYGSLVFPTFISSTPVGSVDIALIGDCNSLSTVVIPVELTTSARAAYFIEMTFGKNPSSQWAPSIAEIQFSDGTPTEPPIITVVTITSTMPQGSDTRTNSQTTETKFSTTDSLTTASVTTELTVAEACPQSAFSTTTYVLVFLVVSFGLIITILSVALVMVSVRLHIYYKRSVNTVKQTTTEAEYAKIPQRNNNATKIEMKRNESYKEPQQIRNNRGNDGEATYDVIMN